MEQINTQVSDLRYLAQAPVALSETASTYGTPRPQPHGSPGSASVGDNSALPMSDDAASNSNKRKSTDDGTLSGKQTRSKRNRANIGFAPETVHLHRLVSHEPANVFEFVAVRRSPCLQRGTIISRSAALWGGLRRSSPELTSDPSNECKRRKIKCNGETPCQRCGNLNLACLYAPNCCSTNFKDSDDFKRVTAQLSRMQDEINWLSQTVKILQTDTTRPAPLSERAITAASSVITRSPSQGTVNMPRPETSHHRHGSFRGPTSLAFNLDVANSTIANMGYRLAIEPEEQTQPSDDNDNLLPPGQFDPLLEFDKDELVRLCRLHEDEVGIMYPVLDIQTVISHAKNLSAYIESLGSQRPREPINDEKTLQLKMVLCCALVVDGHGHSEKAEKLYRSMETVINRKLMSDPSDFVSLPLLALLAGYRFLANDEVLSWRVIGQVARLCLELGINQRMGLMAITDETDRKNALSSFWTAYVLDRRWAFGTGLPYVMQDSDIDPQLPLPEEYPWLVAMVNYARLCAKVWRQVSHFGPVLAQELRQEEIERLDQEILQWYDGVPEEVKVRNWDKDKQITSTPSYNLQRLRIFTYLRLNQIRIWLYMPFLHSATSIMSNPMQAQRVVDLAKDTIQYLSNLNNTTNLYRRLQVFYHQFLTSAISAVFLASVHAPVRFSAVCREEFYLALDLVKDLSAKSWVSKRLWRTIKSLKDAAPRFGLDPDDDAHSSAALGMIGLARGHATPTGSGQSAFSRPSVSVSDSYQVPEGPVDKNGSKIQSEMSRIFEGYVGLNGFNSYGSNETPIPHPNPELPSPGMAIFDMDAKSLVWAAVAIIIAASLYASSAGRITRNGQALRKPPDTLPFIGNGLGFLQARQKLFSWFARCERQFGYETLGISVPTLPPGVIISDPRNLDFVFRNECIFGKGEFFKRRSWDLFGHGIINVDGPAWRAQRRAGLHFLNAPNLRVLTEVALPRYLGEAVRSLGRRADGTTVVDLQAVVHEVTTQLMGKMAYDMEMHADDDFTVAFEHASGATAERFQNPLWFLTEFVTGTRFRKSIRVVKSYGQRIVASAVTNRKAGDGDGDGDSPDKLDDVSGSLIKSLLDAINDEQLVADAALNYLSAGRDTVAQALTWAFYLLIQHRFVAGKLRKSIHEEAEAVVGSVDLTPENLTPAKQHYAMAVFYESLRLYPPVPFEIKQTQQATTLPDGTALPKGAVVVWCPWAMNRSTTTWGPDADQFRPERWLVDGQVVARGAAEFPVFNGGARLCLGKKMAELIAVQVVATLVSTFDFMPAYNGERVSKSSLTLPMEGGLPVYVKKRSSAS
ncbi:Transcriptional activator acu-15 [Paramyrothecium foliicola]|nr:Transcriptional activator acu-15 [Paramyrothecium foliicola]